MNLKAEKKEHKEHQKALKPLLSHLKKDEKKLMSKSPENKMKKKEK